MVHYVVPTSTNPSTTPEKNRSSGGSDDGGSSDRTSKDIKLYVSTNDGLKVLENRKKGKAKKRISFDEDKMREIANNDGHDSVDDEELPPPPLPRKPAIHDPHKEGSKKGSFLSDEDASGASVRDRGFTTNGGKIQNSFGAPPTSPSQSSERSSLSDRSLGAIPKKRPQVSQHQQNSRSSDFRNQKCRREAAAAVAPALGSTASSPISNSSSSVSR